MKKLAIYLVEISNEVRLEIIQNLWEFKTQCLLTKIKRGEELVAM